MALPISSRNWKSRSATASSMELREAETVRLASLGHIRLIHFNQGYGKLMMHGTNSHSPYQSKRTNTRTHSRNKIVAGNFVLHPHGRWVTTEFLEYIHKELLPQLDVFVGESHLRADRGTRDNGRRANLLGKKKM